MTGDYAIVLSLYDSRNAPTAFWEESHVVTVINGLFDARIGADVVNPLTVADFSENAEVWIGITVIEGPGVPDGGEAELPRRRLGSTGYAFAAGHAETADAATHATTADTATSATSATSATTATTAQGVACSGCIGLTHLGFDPATQLELQNALAALDIPTSVHGLSGGTITGGVTVAGALTVDSIALAGGQSVCDSSGNCGVTLASLNCVAPDDTPVYDHDTNAWVCGARLTSDSVVATDLNCSGCVSESALGFDVVTPDALTAALSDYATKTELGDYATKAELGDYATTAALGDYATKAELGDYATTAALDSYATRAELDSYATRAELGSYATRAELDSYATEAEVQTALQSYVTAAALSSALQSYVTVAGLTTTLAAYATKAELANYATKAELPTSVNGLTGGTITSAVTVSGNLIVSNDGTVSAKTLVQDGHAVCDASGSCGASLAGLEGGCQAGQVPTFGGGAWSCQTPEAGGGATPAAPCTGPGEALQWDGSSFICINVVASGLSSGSHNGFELVDDWGFAWDGIARGARSWAEADAACAAVGARLPTATELYRNNATTGTGNVADINATQYLWTRTQSYSTPLGGNGRYVAVRLSDGVTEVQDGVTTSRQFRCVWPDENPDAFFGDNCHGTPGQACRAHGLVWNVDTTDRPKLDWQAAQNECRFYRGTLVSSYDVKELIQDGWEQTTLTGTSYEFIWTSDIWNSGATPYAQLVRWATTPLETWVMGISSNQATSTWINLSSATTAHFRCMGKRSPMLGHLPSPDCAGGCFSVTHRGSRILADSADRDAATADVANSVCRGEGGWLPTVTEFADLVASGWPDGTNENLWTAEGTDVGTGTNNTIGYWTGRWSGDGAPESWWVGTTGTQTGGTAARPYRCVFRETLEEEFTTCTPSQAQVWNAVTGAYECVASAAGDAEENGYPFGNSVNDAWGAVWDSGARPATTFAEASSECTAIGARLPTATELYRVSQNSATSNVLGPEYRLFNANEALWVLNPVDAVTPTRVTINTATGIAVNTVETQTRAFRCIWPATVSDAFSGRSCHGQTAGGADPCFSDGRLRMDLYDRARIFYSSAAWECRFFGGKIPSVEEYTHLIHAGAPNGMTVKLWADDYTYSNNGGTSFGGPSTIRWTGEGTDTWYFPGVQGRTWLNANPSTLLGFRCVFGDTFVR